MPPRKSIKLLFLLGFVIFSIKADANGHKISSAPIANAGPDQTIYLTKTSSVTLNGSNSSGSFFLWTDISTDYKSGAIITYPRSAISTITKLEQGTWYYELAVTGGGITVKDTVVIRVDYDVPPANGFLLRQLPFAEMASVINIRDDTTRNWGFDDPTETHTKYYYPNHIDNIIVDRARLNGMMIDSMRGKLYSILEDGYAWQNTTYNRSELSYGTKFTLDSNKTYLFEWKGYFPQSIIDVIPLRLKGAPGNVLALMQWHGNDDKSPPFFIRMMRDSITFYEGGHGTDTEVMIMPTDYSYIRQTHTVRVTVREGLGYPGQKAFLKVEVDGALKYYRNKGQVGATFQQDYPKFASLYDFNNAIVDPSSPTGGRNFSLVTEEYRVYQLDENQPPKSNAVGNQSIQLPVNKITLRGSGSDADGTITSYLWTKISGPASYNIIDPSSALTDVSGLVQGTYYFELKVTDNSGAIARDTMQVIVNPAANIPPVANAGGNQSIQLPVNKVTLAGSGTDADGTVTNYLWTKILGPASYNIMVPSSALTDLSGLVQGTYFFELKVTDNSGAVARDTMQVIVNPAVNIPPMANAGDNQATQLPINKVTLAGNGTDADGTITSYLWTKISGPASYSIVNPASALTEVSGLVQGIYRFELQVTDNDGIVGRDTMDVMVNPAIIIPITANTGPDQTIILPASTVKLSGSGTGPIIAYQWRQLSGPSTVMSTIDLATASISGLIPGVYQFELKVVDNNNVSERDTMQLVVYPALNTLPLSWLGVQAQWINGSEVKVSWQVAQQQNVKNYTVEYSSDGNNFINACSVISSAITSYNCIIAVYKHTKNYYRVMQTDIDGKTTYSKIVLLQPSTKPALSVYPNPAQDKLYIKGIDKFSEATISDAGGKMINHFSPDASTQYIDISKLVKGIYFIKLVSVNDTQTIKFIKE